MRGLWVIVALAGCEKATPTEFAIGWDMFAPGDRYEIGWTSHAEELRGKEWVEIQRSARRSQVEVLAVDGDRSSRERVVIASDSLVVDGRAQDSLAGSYELTAPTSDGPLDIVRLDGHLTEVARTELERWQHPVMTLMERQRPFFTHEFALGQTLQVAGADATALGYRDFDGVTFRLVAADAKALRFTIEAKATNLPDGMIARPELIGTAEYGRDAERKIQRTVDIMYYDAANQPRYRVHQESEQHRLRKQTAAR